MAPYSKLNILNILKLLQATVFISQPFLNDINEIIRLGNGIDVKHIKPFFLFSPY